MYKITLRTQPYQMVLCRLIHYNIIKAYDLSFNPFATSIILFTEAYALTKDEQHIMLLHRIFFAYCSKFLRRYLSIVFLELMNLVIIKELLLSDLYISNGLVISGTCKRTRVFLLLILKC